MGDGTRIAILYEDRAVLAIDKPAGWMLAPSTWTHTARNLRLAIESCLRGRAFWARCRHLQFLRVVHRLDADTSGVLLFAKSPGALRRFSELFESRRMEKSYLAVVEGVPRSAEWTCSLKIGCDPNQKGQMKVDGPEAREALTRFCLVEAGQGRALVLAQPEMGRTHQVRVHLAAGGHPVLGDGLYGTGRGVRAEGGLALRAMKLASVDPFTRRSVTIEAPCGEFARKYGFAGHAAVGATKR